MKACFHINGAYKTDFGESFYHYNVGSSYKATKHLGTEQIPSLFGGQSQVGCDLDTIPIIYLYIIYMGIFYKTWFSFTEDFDENLFV